LINDNNKKKDALLTDAAHKVAQQKAPPPAPPPAQGGPALSSWSDSLPPWVKNLIPSNTYSNAEKNQLRAGENILNNGAPSMLGKPTQAEAAEGAAQEASKSGTADQVEVPDTGPLPQFKIDQKGINNSQFLGSQQNPPPNTISPAEVGQANQEVAKVKQFNEKIPLIHSNFATMWQNRSNSHAALKYFSGLGINFSGAHLSTPDMTSWNEGSRNYFRAANRIRQELGTLVGNGALTNEQASTVMTNLIKQGDTPQDYKDILRQVDGNILSTIQTPVLDKYGKIRRPKVAE
jgi:hypothetical protein